MRGISARVSSGTSEMPTTKAIAVDRAPAMPKVLISAEWEKSRAMKEAAAVAVASTQAGPTTSTAKRAALMRRSPSISRLRMATVSCMESEKPSTMISGIMTFRNRFSLKPSQPNSPSDQMMAMTGGSAAISHQREAPEEGVGDDRAEQEAERVVEVAVALDRVPDLELHHRRAGELHLERRVLQIFFRRVVDLLNHGIQALALATTWRSSASRMRVSVPSSERSLPEMISLRRTLSMRSL